MYNLYWGFQDKPFENTPDEKFTYYSRQHLEAFTRLLYVITEKKSAAILTGECGSGKTLISRIITNKLLQEEDKYNVALVVNPAISAIEMLKEILYQLGGDIDRESQKIEVLRVLNDRLYKNMNENRHTVVIIDEAQTIENNQVFEEIRLLFNFQADDRFLLTILLLGQPELKLKVGKIPQLEQRFYTKYHLDHLSLDETISYIKHRCKVAGREQGIFTDLSYHLIYETSRGIPRRINDICDISLMLGYSKKADAIDEDMIKMVAEDLKEYLPVVNGSQRTELTEKEISNGPPI